MSDKLSDLAAIIRSKNAGPFELTLDVMFTDQSLYERVRDSGVLTPALIAERYGVSLDRVLSTHWFEPALTFKATLARTISSGTVGDTDVFGAQQHVPLMDIEIP